jgi:hypothetical protein
MDNHLLALLLVASGLYIISCTAQTQQETSGSAKSEESVRVDSRSSIPDKSTGPQAETERIYDQLITKAKAHGSVRVIVHLRMDTWKPEGDLPDTKAAEAQRDTISRLQTKLLKRMTSFAVTNIKLFKYVPHVAMKVDAAGLKDLMSNPDVSGISEDVALPPTS